MFSYFYLSIRLSSSSLAFSECARVSSLTISSFSLLIRFAHFFSSSLQFFSCSSFVENISHLLIILARSWFSLISPVPGSCRRCFLWDFSVESISEVWVSLNILDSRSAVLACSFFLYSLNHLEISSNSCLSISILCLLFLLLISSVNYWFKNLSWRGLLYIHLTSLV